ncbi:hypothetical protein BCR35DRAFT_354448 [Leucosporidium creatinivorum]|uniref:Cenp-O kinetochore centromere component-domain-containing protein n=1 Tax=Leucosporidium creatinivorum TaxID=106004 RepID=A0A1Y2EL28_9BASI|nr:hypothetical protein BCR35DRAFT_354448 [Leucosporidium creatinivorum]
MSTVASASQSESLDSLRQRAAALRAQLAQLRASQPPAPPIAPLPSLTSLRPLPTHSSSSSSHLTTTLPGSNPAETELHATQELARKYRITGRSAFPVELARGVRAKREALEREKKEVAEKGKGKGKQRDVDEPERERQFVKKGVAVRLETFYEGRYYEPYYLVFAPQSDSTPIAEFSSNAEKPPPLQIVHHSIPHWLPLKELSQKYLRVGICGEEDEPAEDDGAELSSRKAVQPDLDLFLTRLLVFLNAHLSRREQLISLRSAYSLSNFTSMDFRIFASESNDRIVVEWDLASPSEEDEEDEEGRTERIVVVQMAFLDLRRSLLATQRSDGMGGSLLVRYVERKPASGEPPLQIVLEELTAQVLKDPKEGRSMLKVIKELVDETTSEGWSAEAD